MPGWSRGIISTVSRMFKGSSVIGCISEYLALVQAPAGVRQQGLLSRGRTIGSSLNFIFPAWGALPKEPIFKRRIIPASERARGCEVVSSTCVGSEERERGGEEGEIPSLFSSPPFFFSIPLPVPHPLLLSHPSFRSSLPPFPSAYPSSCRRGV